MADRKSRRKLPKGISGPHRNADGSVSYYAQFKVKGFPRAFKAKPTLDEAVHWLTSTKAELLKQREAGQVQPDIVTMTLADLNDNFLKDPKVTVLRSFKDIKRQLAWWSSRYGATRVLEFGPLQQLEARNTLIAGRSNATVNRYLAAQRRCWRWARRVGIIPADRTWATELALREPKERKRYLSDQELKSVLAEARKHSVTMHSLITLAIATGMRRGELVRLQWSDIDLARSTLQILETKNGESRVAYLTGMAIEAIKALKSETVVSMSGSVFLYDDGTPLDGERLDRAWKRIRKAAGLQNFRFHDLRHSCASFLIQNGATLAEVGHVLGHKSVSVSARYAHLIEGKPVTGHAALDEKLRGAV